MPSALFQLDSQRRVRRALHRVRAKIRNLPDLERLQADGLVIGSGCFIGRGVLIDPVCCWLITIGDRCVLAPDVMILAHDASTKRAMGYTRVRRTSIGDRVYIGARAIVLPGVTIGSDAIVGAGAVVSRDVGAGEMVVGNPARVVGTVDAHADKHRQATQVKPVFSGPDWKLADGITDARKQEMRRALRDTDGYVD